MKKTDQRHEASALATGNAIEILADVLGLSDGEIGRLHDDGVVAGPTPIGAREA